MELTRVAQVDDSPDQWVWAVTLTTTWSDRAHPSDSSRGDVEEHVVHLRQLVVHDTALKTMRDALRRWLFDQSPLVVELTSERGAALTITIGPRTDVISSVRKPAMIVEYRGIALEFKTSTVIDETCVRIAVEGLEAVLTGPN